MIRSLVLAGVGAAAGFGVARALTAARPLLDRAGRLDRPNHSGASVSLIEGPAVAAGLAVAALALPRPAHRFAAVTATAAAGLLGGIDDLMETGSAKGLRGHLSALARGEVTTGGLKVLGIPAASLLAAAVVREPRPLAGSAVFGRCVDTVLAGGVIAGSANLVNLLDLRPGRALKAAGLVTVLGPLHGPAAVLSGGVLGTAAAVWGEDLAGRTMLGDTGANALGAALGTRTALQGTRGELLGVLSLLVALTLASEKVSFTRVIEATPVLRELDAWGRTPAAPAAP